MANTSNFIAGKSNSSKSKVAKKKGGCY